MSCLNRLFDILPDAIKSDSLASIVTQDSEDQLTPPVIPVQVPPALRTLVLSNSRVGNATIEQVNIDYFIFLFLKFNTFYVLCYNHHFSHIFIVTI